MARKIYYFSGKCEWAQVFQPTPDYDKSKQSYKINLIFDQQSLNMFHDSELQLKLKEHKDGGKYTTFRRPTHQMIKGEVTEAGPPEVIDADGKPMEVKIGNGSDVALKVEVYDSARGKGHRLLGVKVINLIPYVETEVVAVGDIVPF
jgi:hypothetical protein